MLKTVLSTYTYYLILPTSLKARYYSHFTEDKNEFLVPAFAKQGQLGAGEGQRAVELHPQGQRLCFECSESERRVRRGSFFDMISP